MTAPEAKDKIASQTDYKTWENIRQELRGTDQYEEFLEDVIRLLSKGNVSEVAESRKAELDTKQLQKLCTDFFFYWYNTSGSNTYQGCEEWFKTDQAKVILSTLLISGEL